MRTFEHDLMDLINRHSLENESDTPDYVLATYLVSCLESYNEAVNSRKEYFVDNRLLPQFPTIRSEGLTKDEV
jgi:hypothetical protein